MSDALLRHVVPYFGTPHRLLSDRGREFVGEVWGKLMRSLGVQCVLTSSYHPEGNAVNERSHRTMNNMLWARLLEGKCSKVWVEKVPGIMLALNAMVHRRQWSLQDDSLPFPRPPERCVCFSLLRQSHGLRRDAQAASLPYPPADDGPATSSFCQSVPRRESHLCDDDSPRAHQQIDSSVERPL